MILFQEHWYERTNAFRRLQMATSNFFFSESEDWSDYNGDKSRVEAVFSKIGCPIDSSIIKLFPNLKFVLTPTTGVDHISRSLHENKSVRIVSLKGENELLEKITTTAEHAWALLLQCARDYDAYSSYITKGQWSRKNLNITQLSGKVLGIIGYGRLGKKLSRYGIAFGMKVITADIRLIPSQELHKGVSQATHEQLYTNADFIIISANYDIKNASSNLYLAQQELSKVKKSASIINIARGQLLDTKVAIASLLEGNIHALALDVIDDDSCWDPDLTYEQIKDLSKIKNLYLSPHIGGYALDAILDTRNYLLDRYLNLTGAK